MMRCGWIGRWVEGLSHEWMLTCQGSKLCMMVRMIAWKGTEHNTKGSDRHMLRFEL